MQSQPLPDTSALSALCEGEAQEGEQRGAQAVSSRPLPEADPGSALGELAAHSAQELSAGEKGQRMRGGEEAPGLAFPQKGLCKLVLQTRGHCQHRTCRCKGCEGAL